MNNEVVILLVFLLVAGIGLGILLHAGPGNLKHKFVSAGVLRGKTKAEIVRLVGQPKSVSGAPGGKTVLQWMDVNAGSAYHIALLFDANNVCEGVTHEYDATGT